MYHARTTQSIQRYNLFKAAVALVLIAVIAVLLLQGPPDAPTVAEVLPTSTATAAPATSAPPTATAVPTPVEPPVLVEPQVGADGVVAFQGTGAPGSTVELWADGTRLAQVDVGAEGHWMADVMLPPGDHNVSVRAVDADGTLLASSQPVEVAVVAPVKAPVLAAPEVGADGRVSLRGTGTPGSTVEVWSNGNSLGSAEVAGDGTWSVTATLEPGEYAISARAVDASGKAIAESPVTGVVVEAVVPPPMLVSPQPGEIVTGTVTLAGTGAPESEIDILDGGEVVGTAVVEADGTWTWRYDAAPGMHAVTVRAAGADVVGEAIAFEVVREFVLPDDLPDFASMEIECGVDEAPEGVDLGDFYVVAPCEYMGLIAARTGVVLADLLAANPDIENPDLIMPGQIINLPER